MLLLVLIGNHGIILFFWLFIYLRITESARKFDQRH